MKITKKVISQKVRQSLMPELFPEKQNNPKLLDFIRQINSPYGMVPRPPTLTNQSKPAANMPEQTQNWGEDNF